MRALVSLLLVASVRFGHQEVLDDILDSLSKGVSFFEHQSSNMNLDGVVGYVILQGEYVIYLFNIYFHVGKKLMAKTTAGFTSMQWGRLHVMGL